MTKEMSKLFHILFFSWRKTRPAERIPPIRPQQFNKASICFSRNERTYTHSKPCQPLQSLLTTALSIRGSPKPIYYPKISSDVQNTCLNAYTKFMLENIQWAHSHPCMKIPALRYSGYCPTFPICIGKRRPLARKAVKTLNDTEHEAMKIARLLAR